LQHEKSRLETTTTLQVTSLDPRTLVPHLESSYATYAPEFASARDVILAGLQWPNNYWPGLALGWLEDGAPIDDVIEIQLEKLRISPVMPQALRHRASGLLQRYMRLQTIEELDVVRVVALHENNRAFTGTDSVKRAPRIGDIGTVVHLLTAESGDTALVVEALAADGNTLWVADFLASELRLKTKHHN